MNLVKKTYLLASFSFMLLSCNYKGQNSSEAIIPELKNLTQFVDPFIGTGDPGMYSWGLMCLSDWFNWGRRILARDGTGVPDIIFPIRRLWDFPICI